MSHPLGTRPGSGVPSGGVAGWAGVEEGSEAISEDKKEDDDDEQQRRQGHGGSSPRNVQ